jgi:CDP-2,3-bis-(O-geranylgeranyl)-sn-glycerol synthase
MIILEALFFILPTYASNSLSVVSMVIPVLKNFSTPIDFGKSYKGKRILGDGKTFRGFIFGTFCGCLVAVLQYFIAKNVEFKYLTEYNDASFSFFMTTGFLLSFGSVLGDSVKSLIKRRIGIKRGRPWIPFDQLDFITMGILLSSIVYLPGWKIVLILFIITPAAHFLSNVTAYLLKIKDVWW